MNLCDLDVGEFAIIKNVNLYGIKKHRLYDLGIIRGEGIRKVYSSSFGNPICYEVKNSLIALRNEDAFNIEVSYE